MSTQTKIEWTEMTWNPMTGCSKISPGCKHCYAETMAHRLCLQPVYEMRRPEIVAALMRGVMERVAAP